MSPDAALVAVGVSAVRGDLLSGRAAPERVGFAYERGGVVVWNEPIPWNAESVLVEAIVCLPRGSVGVREDFALQVPDGPLLRATGLRECGPERLCVLFRLLPLHETMAVTVVWRSRQLSRLKLPFLGEAEFWRGLRLDAPTLLAQIRDRVIPCAAIVAGQCHGLSCCGLLTSSTSLLPVAGMDFAIEFVHEAGGRSYRVTPTLGRAELTSRRAMVMLRPEDVPDCLGSWSVRCSVAGRPLAALGLRVVTPDTFEHSIYLVDSCYRCEKENGAATIRSYPPLLDDICRLGPSFRVASRQAGVAGLCRLDICARARDPAGLSPRQTHEVLITDAAGSFAHGRLDR